MDILVPLLNKKIGNRFIVILTDRYSKLTRAIPTKSITAAHVGNILLEVWIIPNGILERILTDNGPHFVEKCFNDACVALGTQLMTTTTCHPRTNGGT